MKKTLLSLLLSLTSISCTDRVQFSGEAQFPKLARSERIISRIEKEIGEVRTFKDESEDFKLLVPSIEFQYKGNRFLKNEFSDHLLFYSRLSYNEGEVATNHQLSRFVIDQSSFTAGLGIKTYFLPVDREINFGLDLRVDYCIGDWKASYKTLSKSISFSGTDTGFGFYTGALVEGKFPKILKENLFLGLDTNWIFYSGYNHSDFGTYSDFRGPVFGIGLIFNLTK